MQSIVSTMTHFQTLAQLTQSLQMIKERKVLDME